MTEQKLSEAHDRIRSDAEVAYESALRAEGLTREMSVRIPAHAPGWRKLQVACYQLGQASLALETTLIVLAAAMEELAEAAES